METNVWSSLWPFFQKRAYSGCVFSDRFEWQNLGGLCLEAHLALRHALCEVGGKTFIQTGSAVYEVFDTHPHHHLAGDKTIRCINVSSPNSLPIRFFLLTLIHLSCGVGVQVDGGWWMVDGVRAAWCGVVLRWVVAWGCVVLCIVWCCVALCVALCVWCGVSSTHLSMSCATCWTGDGKCSAMPGK